MTMDNPLAQLTAARKTGAEPIHDRGKEVGFDLLSFWQWSASDPASNATRGRLAEYIPARALGLAATGVRDEWAAFDLLTPSEIRIEVKSAAYVQSWHQRALSSVKFVVRKTLARDRATNRGEQVPRRQADVYVFALLAHVDKDTIDPLNLSQWHFCVVSTQILDQRSRSQHSITLKSLESLAGPPVAYSGIRGAVELAASRTAR
jgi:hypothetical protein